MLSLIEGLRDRVLAGQPLTKSDSLSLSDITIPHIPALFSASGMIRDAFRGTSVELCAIVNAKSGACPEDCSYCAQSSKSTAEISVYPLLNGEALLEKAREAKNGRVKRFSIVTSGRTVRKDELKQIASMLRQIRDIGLMPCASLGLLGRDELSFLRDNGLDRYHHNLETSRRLFPQICRTHTYDDKVRTIDAAQSAGLSVCSGGIIGMGETWEDRVDLAFDLRDLDVQSIPVNFLIPIKGTPLADRELLRPFEALKVISLFRFILPQKEIRICGGRMQVLGEFASMVFMVGADSLMTGNYLTTTGRTFEDDVAFITEQGLTLIH